MNPILIVLVLIGVIVIPLIGTIQPGSGPGRGQGALLLRRRFDRDGLRGGRPLPGPPGCSATTCAGRKRSRPDPDGVRHPRAPQPDRSLSARPVLPALFCHRGGRDADVRHDALPSSPPTACICARARDWCSPTWRCGMVGVALYQLLVIVPSFWFFLLLCFAAGLMIGNQVFSDTPLGKLLSAGITAVFIVLGPPPSPETPPPGPTSRCVSSSSLRASSTSSSPSDSSNASPEAAGASPHDRFSASRLRPRTPRAPRRASGGPTSSLPHRSHPTPSGPRCPTGRRSPTPSGGISTRIRCFATWSRRDSTTTAACGRRWRASRRLAPVSRSRARTGSRR